VTNLNDAIDQLLSWSAEVAGLPGTHEYGLIAGDRAEATAVIATHRDLFAFGGVPPAGATVLDAGCGHGESALAMAALGARDVIAVDVGEEEVETVATVATKTGAPLTPTLGSVFDLPLADDSVDVVVSVEGIGVYADLDLFLDEASRVLLPGGVIVMAEINDVLNPRLRNRARELWRAYELGPAGNHHGHQIDVPFSERRAIRVRELLPEASPDDVEAIVSGSYRFDDDALVRACKNFEGTGELPDSHFDPELAPIGLDRMTVEAPVDPEWMRSALASRGLKPGIAGSWGSSTAAKRAVTRSMRMLGPVARRTAPSIRYRGRN
jgi:SAM-dependent methyltransferase